MRTRPSRALPTAVAAAAALAAVALLPALPAHATTTAAPAPHSAPAADQPSYLVTVREGVDPAAVADAYGIRPTHVFHAVTNGFAARLSPEQAEALRDSAAVVAVEEDGPASSGEPF
ncbi:protease inhibitor I9 family protein [Streptomyces sp. NBC_00091]|uniref:protease inhibitor I9 family protein n=1 Tax=Streptomyces sp. NBC_00091 TaxID=2975648 RepID=UPI00224D5E9A|nr:protease inhibitor I9 family protein [Streptomyces sp. NBC_00091]MCX5376845.1 protease inhibitor I9 family protein [Streptomyces sp. NBC_00091]